MKSSLIYIVQCTLDRNKIYVGKTDRPLDARKKEHEMAALSGDPVPFHRALVTEGIRHWDWRELERCSSGDVVGREKYWIEKLGALSVDLLNVSRSRVSKPSGVVRGPIDGRRMGGKNVWRTPGAKKWLMLSGKLRPVINLTSGRKYKSLTEAASLEEEDRPGIKRACDSGRPTRLENRYAWLDLDDNPILTEGHKKELPRTKSVKNLSTGKTFSSIKDAAQVFHLRYGMVQAVCSGKYKTVKGMSFCYLDEDGKEILKPSHQRWLEWQKQSQIMGYAAYSINDSNFERPYVSDTTRELSVKLGISHSHVLAAARGERQHVNGFRIVFFDKVAWKPRLTPAHTRPIRKIIRKVLCLDDNKTFPSPAAAARCYGLTAGQVALCCRGVLKSTGRGKQRRRFAYLNDRGQPELTDKHSEPFGTKGVRVFCPQLSREFQSVADFCRKTGVPVKRANKHLKDPSIDLGGLELVELK